MMQSVRPDPTDRQTDRRQRQFQDFHDVVMVRYRRSQFLEHRVVQGGSVGDRGESTTGKHLQPTTTSRRRSTLSPNKLPRDNPRTSSATWESRAPRGLALPPREGNDSERIIIVKISIAGDDVASKLSVRCKAAFAGPGSYSMAVQSSLRFVPAAAISIYDRAGYFWICANAWV
jgi:hypothetical protein